MEGKGGALSISNMHAKNLEFILIFRNNTFENNSSKDGAAVCISNI